MSHIHRLVTALALLGLLFTGTAYAQEKQKLFINLASDHPWRMEMALTFAGAVLARGTGVTVWLNNEGVRVGKAQSEGQLKKASQMLADLINKGARVVVCGECLRQFAINERQLLPGATVGRVDTTIALLLDANTQVLSW